MKYTVKNFSYKSFDMDDDMAELIFDIHFTEPEELLVENFSYPFYDLKKILKETLLIFIITSSALTTA